MSGGLMQLVAYGAQDIYLTGNPQISFFKVVYRRHTNFSMECHSQTFNGTVSAEASTFTSTISRNGDLISSMHLDVKMNGATTAPTDATYINWVNNTGHALINSVEIEIGGQPIDKHYGHWLDVWNELSDHEEREYSMINKHKAGVSYLRSQTQTPNGLQLYIPLKFWFCKNPGLAIPLVALQYHEIKVKFQTRATTSLINHDSTTDVAHNTDPNITLWVDYVYLDTDERRRFSQQAHEYLIEQLQYQTQTASDSIKLNFSHPVKELIWTATSKTSAAADTTGNPILNVGGTNASSGNDWFNYHSNGTSSTEIINGQTSNEAFDDLKIQLNGHDRFTKRNASYFRTIQPYLAGHRIPEKHVYCYSFALKPEEHQPSGTCNFSRVDNAKMIFTTPCANTSDYNIYAVNYNIFRIMSGMGGLAYSS